jgi:AraC-like DNA-binding protein
MHGRYCALDVLNRVEDSLMSPPNLTTLADLAGYSPSHLHKVVRNTVGMTIRQYASRRQLTEAARRLTRTEEPVADIAVTSGYGSQQAFTMAFRAAYKQPPAAFRRVGRFYPLQHAFDFREDLDAVTAPSRSWSVAVATTQDLPDWLALTRAGVDMLPTLGEPEHARVVTATMAEQRALLLRADGVAVGALALSRDGATIDLLLTHPLTRRTGALARLIGVARDVVGHGVALSTTTYRAGDRADTGHHADLQRLGFALGERLTEFGYPTQRMYLDPAMRLV